MSSPLAARMQEISLLGYHPEEADFIFETMAALRPDLVCEWGTNTGHSARLFHEARVLLALDCDIHSVELSTAVPVLRAVEKGFRRGHHVRGLPVTLHVGDGPRVALDLYYLSDRERPLFFIDDNHEEQKVHDELLLLAEECPQAVLLLHDAMIGRSQEPDRALRKFLEGNDRYDIASAGERAMVRLWPRP